MLLLGMDRAGLTSNPMKSIARLFLFAYRMSIRLKCKCFSLLVAGAFAQFGKKTVLMCPVRLSGEDRIAIGHKVFIGAGSWLQTLPNGQNRSIAIVIGS